MAASIKHAFQSAIADGTTPGMLQPSNWNEEHTVTGLQETLVSGTNIKTVNNTSLLGSGDISISGGAWGGITGTMSDQSDLQAALDTKEVFVNNSRGDYVDPATYFANEGSKRALIGIDAVDNAASTVTLNDQSTWTGTPWEGKFGNIAWTDGVTWFFTPLPASPIKIDVGGREYIIWDGTTFADCGLVIVSSNSSWVTLANEDAGGPYNADSLHTHASKMTNPMTTTGDMIYGGTAGVPTRLAKGTDGQVLTLAAGVPSWATASGGSGSIDWASPIAISNTATTLTIGKHHVIAETAAARTMTLPAVSGNGGKLISIEITATTTYLVTIDGNASETIDGATTRDMHNSETAILLCNGTTWTKIGGKSIPMVGGMKMGADALNAGDTIAKLNINTAVITPTIASMHDTSGYKIVIPRTSVYSFMSSVFYWTNNATATRIDSRPYINNALVLDLLGVAYSMANQGFGVTNTNIKNFAKNDYAELYSYFSLGSYTTQSTQKDLCYIKIAEFPQW